MTAQSATGHRFDTRAVDGLFAEYLARGAAPAAAWGLWDASGLLHQRSTGCAPGTAFRVASCTKSFTAAALLVLRDEGLIGLDEEITRYVPGLSLAGLPAPDSATPTLRMLLTMSSGLPTDDPWADRQEALGTAEFDAILAAGVRFEAEPGTRFAYSNLGYALLGRVIEAATGLPYRHVVEQRLLAPLGLANTGFDSAVTAPGGIATGHRRHGGDWEALGTSGPGAFSAIGGLFSTVDDLARWAGWLASAQLPLAAGAADAVDDADDADDGVLSRASRREMQQLHRLDQSVTARPTGYGYGLFVEQYSPSSRVVSHSGGYPGFSAHMRWSAEHGIGVLGFANATYSRVSATTMAALDVLLADRERELVSERELGAQAAMPHTLWPETRAAQQHVNALLAGWAAGSAPATPLDPAVFSENVEQDEPVARRLAAVRACAEAIGGVDGAAAGGQASESSEGPAHLVWMVQGRSGRMRVEIRLTPEAAPRVQTLLVGLDRAGR